MTDDKRRQIEEAVVRMENAKRLYECLGMMNTFGEDAETGLARSKEYHLAGAELLEAEWALERVKAEPETPAPSPTPATSEVNQNGI